MRLAFGPLPSLSAQLWIDHARLVLAGVRAAGSALPVELPGDVERAFVGYLDEWESVAGLGDVFEWSAEIDDEYAGHLIVYFFGVLSVDDDTWIAHGLPYTPDGAEVFMHAISAAVVDGLSRAGSELGPSLGASWPRGEVSRPWRAEPGRLFRVVVVDDTEDIRLLLELTFNIDGRFDMVGTATNGREGIDLCQQLQPDGILLDVMMPVLDGVAALPELRKACPHARIVMLSAGNQKQLASQCRDLGADAFVSKGEALDVALQSLLGETRGAAF